MNYPEIDNLEMDTKRALDLGYGVQYGRFKADYPHTMDEPIIREEDMGNCQWCGELFYKRRKDLKFCCDACRLKYRHANKRNGDTRNQKRVKIKNCLICGKPVRGKMMHYCSIECSAEANRRRSRKAARKKDKREE